METANASEILRAVTAANAVKSIRERKRNRKYTTFLPPSSFLEKKEKRLHITIIIIAEEEEIRDRRPRKIRTQFDNF